MYDHIGLKVKDIDASVRFWGAAPAAFGHVLCSKDAETASFGPPGSPGLWLLAGGEGRAPGPVHVALRADDRSAVDYFHRAGVEAGGRDHGKPGVRGDYGPSYYAAFLIDPDGNNVEAVCMR